VLSDSHRFSSVSLISICITVWWLALGCWFMSMMRNLYICQSTDSTNFINSQQGWDAGGTWWSILFYFPVCIYTFSLFGISVLYFNFASTTGTVSVYQFEFYLLMAIKYSFSRSNFCWADNFLSRSLPGDSILKHTWGGYSPGPQLCAVLSLSLYYPRGIATRVAVTCSVALTSKTHFL
jgi:hypothetical protein